MLKKRFYPFLKSFFFSFFFLIFFSNATAQNFENVDAKAKSYPAFSSTELIAQQLNMDFKSDLDKVRALYIWMTKNIAYDLKEFYSGPKQYTFRYASKEELDKNIEERKRSVIRKTLGSKKAVCEGYAQTFKRVCDNLSISCEVISGYSKTQASEIGKLPLGGKHAWNAVRINNRWQFVDATWGAGYVSDRNVWIRKMDDYFFFTPAEEMLNSHFPENEKWQLLNQPISAKEFSETPILNASFFKSKVALIQPTNGTLNYKNDFYIFQFKNVSNGIRFSYAYENDTFMKAATTSNLNGITTLKIPTLKKRNTALHLIIGADTVADFKIN